MKFCTVLLALASATIGSSSVLAPQQATLADDALKVPGDNPLYFCSDPSQYLGHIKEVNLSPNPPVAGQKLYITANGTLDDNVGEGSYVLLTVKYGLITLLKQHADLCENLPKIDIECPLEKGELDIAKEADIPSVIPPGTYSVLADARNEIDEIITCMTATVRFTRGG